MSRIDDQGATTSADGVGTEIGVPRRPGGGPIEFVILFAILFA